MTIFKEKGPKIKLTHFSPSIPALNPRKHYSPLNLVTAPTAKPKGQFSLLIFDLSETFDLDDYSVLFQTFVSLGF